MHSSFCMLRLRAHPFRGSILLLLSKTGRIASFQHSVFHCTAEEDTLHKTPIDEANKPSGFSVHFHRSMLRRAVSSVGQRSSSWSSALESPLHCSSSAPASSVCQHQTRSIISIPVTGNKVTIFCGMEACGGLQEV